MDMDFGSRGVDGVDVHSGGIRRRVGSAVKLDRSGGGSSPHAVQEVCFGVVSKQSEILSVLCFGFG